MANPLTPIIMIVNGSMVPNSVTFTWMEMRFHLQTMTGTFTTKQQTENNVNFDSYSKLNGCIQVSYIQYSRDNHE
jgi:hypothetical protein